MKITIGLLAHVDAGKTTLAEAILYYTKTINKLGTITKNSTFLDYNDLERNRGITIFNKQANFSYNNKDIILIDTPGHFDLSNEMEKSLRILDYAILLINAHSLVQSQTKVIYKKLKEFNIPTIIFVNKMDSTHYTKYQILDNIRSDLVDNCIDLTEYTKQIYEDIALTNEEYLNEYLNTNKLSSNSINQCIKHNGFIPVIFGSASKLININNILDLLEPTNYNTNNELEGYIYSVEYINNVKVAHTKILSGSINVKDTINNNKINEIRLYNGNKYTNIKQATVSDIVSLIGINDAISNTYLSNNNTLPIDNYSLIDYLIVANIDNILLFKTINILNNQDPTLKIRLNDNNVLITLTGQFQKEIITNIIKEKFNIDVSFKPISIVYKEAILNIVEGVGHYEPKGHYAEVHVLLEPNLANTGLIIRNGCNDQRTINQQLILLDYLNNKTIKGVINNSELTNTIITILHIAINDAHTQSLDIKYACDIAIRQALMIGESNLLEPYYKIETYINSNNISNILFDLEKYKAEVSINDNYLSSLISVNNYQLYKQSMIDNDAIKVDYELTLYDYLKVNDNNVLNNITYNALSDLDNSSSSIFFNHGKSFIVSFDKTYDYMHIPLQYKPEVICDSKCNSVSDEELRRVTSSLFIKKEIPKPRKSSISDELVRVDTNLLKQYLIIDGYNLMHEIKAIKDIIDYDLMTAREKVISLVSDYCGYTGLNATIVFDAYNTDSIDNSHLIKDNVEIVYTKHNLSADMYIQEYVKNNSSKFRFKVVTSDRMIQLSVFSSNALRISSRIFIKEYEDLKIQYKQ